jgi:hypothetical protein
MMCGSDCDFGVCADQDACNFFMPCAAVAAAAAATAAAAAATGKESAVQGTPAESAEGVGATDDGVDGDSLRVAMSSMSRLTLGARESGRSEDAAIGGKQKAASPRSGRAKGEEEKGRNTRESAATVTNTTTATAAATTPADAPAAAVPASDQRAPPRHRDPASKGREEEAGLQLEDKSRGKSEEKRTCAGKSLPSAGEVVLAGVGRRDDDASGRASRVSALEDGRLKNVLIDDDEALSTNWCGLRYPLSLFSLASFPKDALVRTRIPDPSIIASTHP